MVRASRNVSNAARAIEAAHPPFAGEHTHFYPAVGESVPHSHAGDSYHSFRAPDGRPQYAGHIRFEGGQARILAAARGLPPVPEPSTTAAAAPPGAQLDRFAWAQSWGGFLRAIGDDRDEEGARVAINRVVKNLPRNAGMGERVPSEGGFLVPWKLQQQVLSYMTRAIVRPRAMVVPMEALRTSMPLLDNPSQADGAQALAGLTFSMVEPGAPIPATNPQFGRLTLEARKAAAYLQAVPNELIDDASAAFGDFLARIVAMGLGWFEDSLFISVGTGVGQPQALLNSPAAVTVTRATADEVAHSDVVAMLKALHPASKKSALWLMSEDVFDFLLELYEIVGTAPSGQMIPPPQTLVYDMAFGCWRLLGVPVEITDHLPVIGTTGDLVLFDPSLYAVGDLQTLTVERSAKGSGFASNTSNFRLRVRLDGRFWPQEPYTLANGKTVSPLVVLGAAA